MNTGAADTGLVRREREEVLASISANLRGTCVYRTIMHTDGRVECAYVSPNVEALIGLPPALFVPDATRLFAQIVPEDLPGFRQNLAHAFACRGTAEFVARVRHVDGRLLWGQFRSHLVESRADGAQVRDGVVVDITAAKAAESELHAVRQRLELALSAANTCIWDYNLPGSRFVLDVRWATMRGYPPVETTTTWRPLLAVAHPDDRAAIVAETRRVVYGESDEYRIEQRAATASGGWMWILSHGRVVERDAAGRATRISGTNTDITARKSAEEEVRSLNANLERIVQERTAQLAARTEQLGKSEQLFRSLIEDINQGYYVADRRSLFTYCSPAVIAYAGSEERELLGKSVFRIVAPEDRTQVIATYHQWMREGALDGRIEFRLAEKWRGRIVWVEQTSVFVRDGAGTLTEIRCSVRNITERKVAEFALAAEQRRTGILAQVGRELAGAATPKDAAMKILDAAQELLGWESSWVHLWNEEERKFEDVADFDLIDGEIREVPPNPVAMAEPTPTARKVMQDGPQLILREDESDPAGTGALFGSNRPALSLAFVPIRFGLRLIGILSIQSYRRHAYDAAGLEVLLTLATHCAGALSRQQDAAALRLSNERFQAVFERSPIPIALVTVPEGRLVEVNAAAITEFGYAREEALGRTAMELGLWADSGERERYLGELLRHGVVTDCEVRMRRKNGEGFTALQSGSRIELAGKSYSLTSVQDITARRVAEQAIAHSVASLRATLESTADGILTIGPDGKIASFNQPFRKMWRIPAEVLEGQDDERALQFVISQLADAEQFLAKVRHLYTHPEEESVDVLEFKDGRVFERYSRPMFVQGVASAGRVWSFRDITERNRAKQRVAAFAKLGRQLSATDRTDEAGRIIADIADELFGWDSATLDFYDAATDRCRSVFNIDIVEGQRQKVPSPRPNAPPTARTRRAIQFGSELILRELPLRQVEGEIVFGDKARLSASLMIVAMRHGQQVVGVLSIQSYAFHAYTRDDLDAMQALADHCAGALFRIRATHALQASEERLRLVWEHATDGMRLTDADGMVIAVNGAFCAMVGKSRAEVEGRPFSECYLAADRARMLARQHERFVARAIEPHQERSITLWDGRVVRLEVSTAFIETDLVNPLLLGVFRDVTARYLAEQEKEKMQTRLFQNQKFEALGTLAGGVAHDFNNILAGMLNYTALAREDCPPTHPEIWDYLGEVIKGGQRAKELVRQILLLSRSEGAERVPAQVALVVREALSLLRSTIPATVEIKSDIDPRAPLILADASQLHRVIMNLGINAAHAMAARGGTLTVRLREQMVGPALAAEIPELKPGRHVWVEVADTGCGMEPAVVARIFEPFFTTKKTGEGTGLGLAVVRSVVRTHEGAIRLRTKPGEGTTFELYFPVTENVVSPPASASTEYPRGQGQRILLVDDETMVTRSMQLVLERLGYVVTVFNRPEPALVRFESGPDDFDLVITDFQMPGMTGIDLAKRLLARRPGVGIYIASGFAGNLTVERVRELGMAGLMRKPIEMQELAEVLARAFGRQS